MPRRDLTFRVFVSSTFSDLVAERNSLQERVFPRLRDYCRSRGARFQAVDLRWGVSQEAALDQQTMNICLQELRRCQQLSPRPNFIVLLGDRYGWQPLPPQIDAGEFELLLNSLPDEVDRRRLLRWYRRDDNALPAEYCLLPRSEPFTDGEGWSVEEAALLAILSRAVEQAIPAGDPRRRKYEESATHQEIRAGVLDAEDAAGHVFCYFRQIEDLPRGHEARGFRDLTRADAPDRQAAARLHDLKTELETRLPPGHVYKYEAQWSGQAPQSDLDALCERVERNLRNVIDAELEAYEDVSELQREIDAHREFGTARRRHFIGRQAVLGTIRDYLAGDRRGPLVIHGCSGSGKTALLAQAWAEHADQAGDAAIVGRFLGATPAASDLYSVLTSLCRQISQTYGDDTPIAGDVHELARSLPERFAVATPQRPLVLFLDAVDQLSPTDGAHTLSWLPRELPAHVKLVVSVLQVEGPAGESYKSARRLLPADALVELGGLPPGEGKQLLDAWLADAHRTLQPEQKQHILARFAGCPWPLYLKLAFEEARRWKSDDGLPTGSDDVPGLSGDIPGILHDLFWRLERPEHHGTALVQSALASLAAGRAGLVEDELLDVLSADERVIADFRRRSPHSPDVDHLPAVVWSRLYADLEPYLTTRRSDEAHVLSFYHRQLIEAVESRYLQGEDRQRAHGRLARYFAGRTRFAEQPHEFTDPAGGRQPNRRKVSELPYQQTRAELWDDLSETLTDLPFLEAKTAAALVFDLANDFSQAGNALPGEHPQRRILTLLDEALRRDLHFIDRHREDYPQALFQSLWNTCWWYDSPQAAEHCVKPDGGWTEPPPWHANGPKLFELLEEWQRAKQPQFHWLCAITPSTNHALGSPVVAVFPGGDWDVVGLNVNDSQDENRLLAVYKDGTFVEWFWKTGLPTDLKGQIPEHASCFTRVVTCRVICIGSESGSVSLINADNGTQMITLSYPGRITQLVSVPHTNHVLICWRGDSIGGIECYDVVARQRIYRLGEDERLKINACAVSTLGNCGAFAASGSLIRLFDPSNGEITGECVVRGRTVVALAFLSSEDVLIAVSERRRISSYIRHTIAKLLGFRPRLKRSDWASACITRIPHKQRISDLPRSRNLFMHLASGALEVGASGRLAIVGSLEGVCETVNTSTLCRRSLLNIGNPVRAVSITSDESFFFTGSKDGSVRVVELSRLRPQQEDGLRGAIRGCCYSPDGHQLFLGTEDGLFNFDARTGQHLWTHRDDRITDCDVHPNGSELVYSTENGEVKRMSLKRGRHRTYLLYTDGAPTWSVRYSACGKYLASACEDGSVTRWVRSRFSWPRRDVTSRPGVPALACVFDPRDPRVLGYAWQDGLVGKVEFGGWSQPRYTAFGVHPTLAYCIAWDPVRHRIASGDWQGNVCIYPSNAGMDPSHPVMKMFGMMTITEVAPACITVGKSYVYCCSFSPDGKRIAVGAGDCTVRLYDVDTGMERFVHGQHAPIRCVRFSPDGKALLIGDEEGEYRQLQIKE